VSYEFRIGWRYLYRGVGSRKLAIGLVVSALLGLVGASCSSRRTAARHRLLALAGGMLFTAVLLRSCTVFSVFTTCRSGVVFGVAR
jgi:hypothetical protein